MTTTTDTPEVAESRERFERWIRSVLYDPADKNNDFALRRSEGFGMYVDNWMFDAWNVWEACRTFERKQSE